MSTPMMISTTTQLTFKGPIPALALLEEFAWGLPSLQAVEQLWDGLPGHEVQHGLHLFLSGDEVALTEELAWIRQWLTDTPELAMLEWLNTQAIHEQDWATHWKRYWHPERITPRLWVSPSWEPTTPAPGEQQLILDPGMAFGTGAHASTRLMLQAMDNWFAQQSDDALRQTSILDVGCGSGVLAIAAGLWGRAHLTGGSIRAIDIEALAAQVTQENAAINTVSDLIVADTTPLEGLCHHQYNLMLMNIVAPVIETLLPEALLRLAPGGTLLLSGIVKPALPALQAALDNTPLTLVNTRTHEDWVCLELVR